MRKQAIERHNSAKEDRFGVVKALFPSVAERVAEGDRFLHEFVADADMADELLLLNHPVNRNIRSDRIDLWVRCMTSGMWKQTSQGIILDTEYFLANGQHRLTALSTLDIKIPLSIMFNEPEENFTILDVMAPRTPYDGIQYFNSEVSCEDMAVFRWMEWGYNAAEHRKIRVAQEWAALDSKHRAAINFVLSNIGTKQKGIRISPVIAAMALAYYRESDRERLASAIRVLGTSEMKFTDQAGLVRFRNWLLKFAGFGGSSIKKEIFLKTMKVIYCYMHSSVPSKIYITENERCLYI